MKRVGNFGNFTLYKRGLGWPKLPNGNFETLAKKQSEIHLVSQLLSRVNTLRFYINRRLKLSIFEIFEQFLGPIRYSDTKSALTAFFSA